MGRKLPAELLFEIVLCVRREHAHASICLSSLVLCKLMLPRASLWRKIWVSAFFKLKEKYEDATAAGQNWNVVRHSARADIASNNVIVALDRLMDVPQAPDKKAICVLANNRADSKEGVGTVMFQQKDGKDVRVTVEISGLGPDQQHALTINQFGDLSVSSGNFHSTGKHFSHAGQKHGPPEAVSRHVGDLGNITADPKGVAKRNWSDKVISLYGQNNIIGRSVAVHARKDDFGEGTQDVIRSRESGNAGPILSCGVVGLAFDTNMSTRSEDFQREFLQLTQAYRAAETTETWNMVVGCASGNTKCGALIKALQQLMELPHPQQCDSGPRKAVCWLACPKLKDTKGAITFKQETRDTCVTISGNLSGIGGSTQHGFTIHEFGDLSGDYETVGGHFNPTNQVHGGPEDIVRHVGDLGNIDGGSTNFPSIVNKTNGLISLFDGFNNVIGRALVVHQFRDDLGRGVGDDQSESQRTGNAGGAIALGVIGIAGAQ